MNENNDILDSITDLINEAGQPDYIDPVTDREQQRNDLMSVQQRQFEEALYSDAPRSTEAETRVRDSSTGTTPDPLEKAIDAFNASYLKGGAPDEKELVNEYNTFVHNVNAIAVRIENNELSPAEIDHVRGLVDAAQLEFREKALAIKESKHAQEKNFSQWIGGAHKYLADQIGPDWDVAKRAQTLTRMENFLSNRGASKQLIHGMSQSPEAVALVYKVMKELSPRAKVPQKQSQSNVKQFEPKKGARMSVDQQTDAISKLLIGK